MSCYLPMMNIEYPQKRYTNISYMICYSKTPCISQAKHERRQLLTIIESLKLQLEVNIQELNHLVKSIKDINLRLNNLQDLETVDYILLHHLNQFTYLMSQTQHLMQSISSINYGRLPPLLFSHEVVSKAINSHKRLLKEKSEYKNKYFTNIPTTKVSYKANDGPPARPNIDYMSNNIGYNK